MMSFPAPRPSAHRRRYSWTPSLPGNQETRDASSMSGDAHSAQHLDPSQASLFSVPSSHNSGQSTRGLLNKEERKLSQNPLRSFLSRITPGSNKTKKESVVTRKTKLRSKANMESDKNYASVPSSRTLTPGPLESVNDRTTSTQENILPPSISVDIPSSDLQDHPKAEKDAAETPPLSSKSVTFASPVKAYSPQRFYSDIGNQNNQMVTAEVADRRHSAMSNAYSLDSDFHLNTRRRSTEHPVEKLKKRTSVFSMRRLSSLPTKAAATATPDDANLAQLGPKRSSSTSSSKSLSDHFAFLRLPSKPKRASKSSTSSPTTTPALDSLSDLPADRVALEGRVNYHISRLDRHKRRLADLNLAIQQEAREYSVSITNLRRQGMTAAADDLGMQLQWLRESRDGLRPSIAFHRGELARLGRKRLEMDVAEGYDAVLPAIFAGLDGDEAWEQRFAA